MMQRLWIAFAALLLLLSAPAHAQFKTPEAGVRALYAMYSGPSSNGFPRKGPAIARFFTPSLVKLWHAARNIDADFFIQGQDFEIAGLKVAPASIQGDKATVVASFTNFKKPMRLTYEFVRSKDGWRISDVKSGRSSFRDELRNSR